MKPYEKLIFVDLETTGANLANDRITEIGIVAVHLDGEVERWSSFVNPGQPIPSFIQGLTGISDDMVETAPSFESIADVVHERLADGLFIAHNARFDYGFLHHAFARTGHALQSEMLCTVKLSRALFPEEKRHNLDTLIERHGLIPEARHRALADADLLWQFWGKLVREMPQETLTNAVKKLRQRPNFLVPSDIPH
ncbi:3'-5' exonuclease [Herminiimonas fonticola]|uniref:DNA-directed DNA polymerase n=1 Tax=Herminiimonas fonticola TaxID=303380 RepID=A0A4R6G4U1_9BURK|nr:dnaq: exonuclease, DNA polymerase III, epsilon subunit family [Herminiimonas fonticola]TDN89446.1 DNA polymerase-3 subunit epsilon [Herminiimonas fonticola]